MSRLFIIFLSFIFIFTVCKLISVYFLLFTNKEQLLNRISFNSLTGECEEFKGTTVEIEAIPITDDSNSGSSSTINDQDSEDEPPPKESGRQFVRQPEITIPTSTSADRPKLNVLEVLKGMGSAIQMLISQHKHQVNNFCKHRVILFQKH